MIEIAEGGSLRPERSRRMKLRILALTLLVAFSLSLAAQTLVGDGRMKSENRAVPAFTRIEFAGSGNLSVRRGPRRLSLSFDGNLLPYVETKVSGGTLRISLRPGIGVRSMLGLEVDVVVPSIEGVSISGSGNVRMGFFEGRDFAAGISGSGTLDADLRYSKIVLNSSGSGDFTLRGRCDSLEVSLSGSGSLAARDLRSAAAMLTIAGSGDAELRAADRLSVTILGSGSLRYWGQPRLEQKILGSGGVLRAGG